MHRFHRYTGIAGVTVLWTVLLAASARGRLDLLGDLPVSDLGAQPESAALFTVALAVSAVLLISFHVYVRRQFPVSAGFSSAMLIGLAGQLVAAFVPIGGNPAVHRVHTTFALILGASLPLLMWRFAAGQAPGPWRRAMYRLVWTEVGACAAGLFLSAGGVAALAEVLPAAVFHAWVFVVTLAMPAPRRALAGTR